MKKFNIEIQDENITRNGIKAILDFYRTLAIDEQQLQQTISFATGVNSPFLNVFFDLREKITNSEEIASIAANFFDKHQVPWAWFITPATNENDLAQQGLSLIEEAPAMYFSLSNELPTINSTSIFIEEVDENDNLKKWIEPINEAFQVKEGDDSYRKLNETILKKDKNKLRHYVAYYKDKLAGAATLFLTDDAIMLHNLATKAEFKNLGVGTALTLHMMEVAKSLGFKDCYLDSSDEAFNLYKRIGFKIYCSTLIYCKS